MAAKVNLCIRGFLEKRRVFESFYHVVDDEVPEMIAGLGESHAHMMERGTLDMIEIEFLDEPDVNERFFRFGVNPTGMVKPIRVNLASGDVSSTEASQSVPEEEKEN